MIFNMRLSSFLWVMATALFIYGCSDSDEYLFDQADASERIEIHANVTTSFDSVTVQIKADTIKPGDSLIFLTSVYPSKSIRNQDYFWTLDGKPFSNEYSVKKTIYDPGIHEVAFVFVDFFGDTLRDILTITVASPPELDEKNFIPAPETQNIELDRFLQFAWNANDPDSMWSLKFNFTLWESPSQIIVDTILDRAQYTYKGQFKPLQKYHWQVSAYNQFDLFAKQTINGTFFTAGIEDESGIYGSLETSTEGTEASFRIILKDSSQRQIREERATNKSNTFSIKSLSKGKYTLYAFADNLPDFVADSIDFTLKSRTVKEIPTIVFYDNVPPVITGISESDTLDIADTLRFIVHDGGGPLPLTQMNAQLDDKNLQGLTFSNDTLYVPLDTSSVFWSYRIITISAADNSGNKRKKSFYLRPNSSLPEAFGE